jgi:hypothetical protein
MRELLQFIVYVMMFFTSLITLILTVYFGSTLSRLQRQMKFKGSVFDFCDYLDSAVAVEDK